jgi:hypothetical protein
MTSLGDLQRMIRDAMFEPDRDGPALRNVSGHIKPAKDLTAIEHIHIYRNAILGTLVRTLGNIYPVCKRVVGDEFFDAMARKFARQSPSRSADLSNYGADFAAFIADFEPAAALPYLEDVATLEWHWHLAFNAADEAGIDTTGLAAVSAEDIGRLTFRLPCSGQLIASEYPIYHIWQVNQEDWEGAQDIDLASGGCRLIVWRQNLDMRIDELTETEWTLLRHVEQAASFETLATHDNLDTLLPACFQHGWIAGYTLSEASDHE